MRSISIVLPNYWRASKPYLGGLSDVNNFRSSAGSSSRRNDCCRSSASKDNGMPASPWVDMIAVFSRQRQAADLVRVSSNLGDMR
jgi:hypothetical protein